MDENTATQEFCNLQGFNVQTDICYLPGHNGAGSCQFRIGLIMNENGEGDCGSSDTALGIGFNNWAAGATCSCCQAGGTCASYFDVVARFYVMTGYYIILLTLGLPLPQVKQP